MCSIVKRKTQNKLIQNQNRILSADDNINDLSLLDVEEAIKRLKNNKLPGLDDYPTELLKCTWRKLGLLCKLHEIWRNEKIPQDCSRSFICPLLGKSKLNITCKVLSNIFVLLTDKYDDW